MRPAPPPTTKIGDSLPVFSYDPKRRVAIFYAYVPGSGGRKRRMRTFLDVPSRPAALRLYGDSDLARHVTGQVGHRRYRTQDPRRGLMPPFGPVKRRDLIRHLARLGFEGPFPGGRHQFVVRGDVTIRI